MTLYEIIDRQKQVIASQAELVVELVAMLEQAELTGPGVDSVREKMHKVEAELDEIEAGSRQYFNSAADADVLPVLYDPADSGRKRIAWDMKSGEVFPVEDAQPAGRGERP